MNRCSFHKDLSTSSTDDISKYGGILMMNHLRATKKIAPVTVINRCKPPHHHGIPRNHCPHSHRNSVHTPPRAVIESVRAGPSSPEAAFRD